MLRLSAVSCSFLAVTCLLCTAPPATALDRELTICVYQGPCRDGDFIAVNICPDSEGGLAYGDSLILSPQGEVLAEARLFREQLVTAKITPARTCWTRSAGAGAR